MAGSGASSTRAVRWQAHQRPRPASHPHWPPTASKHRCRRPAARQRRRSRAEERRLPRSSQVKTAEPLGTAPWLSGNHSVPLKHRHVGTRPWTMMFQGKAGLPGGQADLPGGQHDPAGSKAPTNLTILLSLALIATPLTVDQRGGFGVNQASAPGEPATPSLNPGLRGFGERQGRGCQASEAGRGYKESPSKMSCSDWRRAITT